MNTVDSIKSDSKATRFLGEYKEVLILFAVSRLVFALMMLISGKTYLQILDTFDGELYKRIASEGYSEVYLTAFFPMIPLIIRSLTQFGLIAVNQISLIFSMVILQKIIKDRYKSPYTTLILTIFAFAPVSFFSLVNYTESIFFLITIAAYYLFICNHRPVLMGILIGLSVFTRNTGAVIFFAIFIGMCIRFIRKETKFSDILKAYISATIISLIYPVYLQIEFGNWKIFADCQYTDWYKIRSNIFKTIYIQLQMIFTETYPFHGIDRVILFRTNEIYTLLITALLIYISVMALRGLTKAKADDIVAAAILIGAILLFNTTIRGPELDAPTDSFFRYYLGLFPAFTLLNKANDKVLKIWFMIAIFMGCFTSFIFSRGVFFF